MVPWAKWITSEVRANEKGPEHYRSCPTWDNILSFIHLEVIMPWRQAIGFAHPLSLPFLMSVLGQNTSALLLLTACFYFLLMSIVILFNFISSSQALKNTQLCVFIQEWDAKLCLKISFSSCHSALLWCRWENPFQNFLKSNFELDAME